MLDQYAFRFYLYAYEWKSDKKKIVIFSFVYIYIFSVVFFGTFEYMSDGYGYFAYVSYTNDECVFFTIIIL